MNERLRELREKEGLSRAAFGARLGVSGDTINNLERGRAELRDSMIKLICAEFNANEEWIRTGSGSMYADPDNLNLVEYAKEHGADDLTIQILKTLFSVDSETRKKFMDEFEKLVAARDEEIRKSAVEMSMDDIEKAADAAADRKRAEYRQQLIDEKKAAEKSSASNITKAG